MGRSLRLIVTLAVVGALAMPTPAHAVEMDIILFGFFHISGPQGDDSTVMGDRLLGLKVKLEQKSEVPDQPHCRIEREVYFDRYNKKQKKWKNVAMDETGDNGVAKAGVTDRTGKYRARLKVVPAPDPESFECYKKTKVMGTHTHD